MVDISEFAAPDPEKQIEIISASDNAGLEAMRQHALGTMNALSQNPGTVPPEYSDWGKFVGDIEKEQRRRLG